MGYEQHGMTNTPEYQCWRNILMRCFNPKTRMYPRYGGRGITICDEWRDSFLSFYQHVGPRPSKGHSIDRIDNDGDYEPGNVRWATRKEQQANLAKSILLTRDGETHCVREWSRRLGVSKNVILRRIHSGWPPNSVLENL